MLISGYLRSEDAVLSLDKPWSFLLRFPSLALTSPYLLEANSSSGSTWTLPSIALPSYPSYHKHHNHNLVFMSCKPAHYCLHLLQVPLLLQSCEGKILQTCSMDSLHVSHKWSPTSIATTTKPTSFHFHGTCVHSRGQGLNRWEKATIKGG